ncbi:5'/3'-nucleotidase SurE [Halodesulfurarchaeum sp. HSR-GB]|uniref:5'/3'-nucleotidase SurE n=1 Tax=Halodesulfurarchaeum sp. HSR-GB TaxID=3074077 RepID=UPI0028609BA9|nr:5'/3'-nucleotidase SurE [Halodesulfurarchaeum sp. HSR-GB]MDR5657504.1 5'/3'-nucleotidase SurE [Halodesulfurarchaeum sp. HSR-GB]
MSGSLDILVTNDDGIESPGIRALAQELSTVGEVTVVAPADNKSAVGRASSREVRVRETDLGYAIEGTPVDCVVAGIGSLAPYPDVVVAGINKGANLGMYVLGRSGTVSAAVEAAFFDVPSIATSLYLPDEKWKRTLDIEAYDHAARATRHLVENAVGSGVFEEADYLNLNAPDPDVEPQGMRVTRPSRAYDMTAERDGEWVSLKDRMWQRMETQSLADGSDTDRRAVVEGHISVSPLTAPHTPEGYGKLEDLVASY